MHRGLLINLTGNIWQCLEDSALEGTAAGAEAAAKGLIPGLSALLQGNIEMHM